MALVALFGTIGQSTHEEFAKLFPAPRSDFENRPAG
jgi:hypothetical protein